jgi:hypothetical protein
LFIWVALRDRKRAYPPFECDAMVRDSASEFAAQRAELLDEAGVFDPEIVSEQRTDR